MHFIMKFIYELINIIILLLFLSLFCSVFSGAHIMTTTGDNSNKQLLAEQPPKTMKHARKSLVAITPAL